MRSLHEGQRISFDVVTDQRRGKTNANSLDDTLSDEQVLEELRALRADRSTFTIVDGPTAKVRRPQQSAVASRLWRQLLRAFTGGI